MATKTISVRLDAYERLRNARHHPRASFSDVILRGLPLVTRNDSHFERVPELDVISY